MQLYNIKNAQAVRRVAREHLSERETMAASWRSTTSVGGGRSADAVIRRIIASASLQNGAEMQASLKRRVYSAEAMSRALLDRIQNTEHMIQQVGQRVLQMQREYELKGPILAVAERRIDLRTQRPPEHQVQDRFQEALEGERQTLTDTRRVFAEYADAGLDVLSALQCAKAEVVKYAQANAQLMRLLRSSLRYDYYHGRDRACVLPSLPQATDHLASVISEGAPPIERAESPTKITTTHLQDLVGRTRALEEAAERLCLDADAALAQAKRDIERASANTTACMRTCIAVVLKLKRALQKEIGESGETIQRTESSLREMAREIEQQGKTLRQLGEQQVPLSKFDQRLPQCLVVNMRDSEVFRIREQMETLRMSIELLEDRSVSARSVLETMRKTHEQLVANHANTSKVWNIDTACAKVSPIKSEYCSQMSDSMVNPSVKPPLDMEEEGGRRPSHNPSPRSRRLLRPLKPQVLSQLRSKIKSASYTGHAGRERELDVIFSRFDKDGSGALEEDEVRQALRRALRISGNVVTDSQISTICGMLDSDGSGAVSIEELVSFVGDPTGPRRPRSARRREIEEAAQRRLERINEKTHTSAPTPRISSGGECSCGVPSIASSRGGGGGLTSSHALRSQGPSSGGLGRGRPRRVAPLAPAVLDALRSKIKAASYAGHFGRELEGLLSSFDRDGSGQLDDEEFRRALRRTLRIPPSAITDSQISSLCAMFDTDGSGTVSIAEIVAFVGEEPENSKRTGHGMRASLLKLSQPVRPDEGLHGDPTTTVMTVPAVVAA